MPTVVVIVPDIELPGSNLHSPPQPSAVWDAQPEMVPGPIRSPNDEIQHTPHPTCHTTRPSTGRFCKTHQVLVYYACHKHSRLLAFASQILSQTLKTYLLHKQLCIENDNCTSFGHITILYIIVNPPWFGSRNTKPIRALESTSQGENSPLPQGRTRSGFHPT